MNNLNYIVVMSNKNTSFTVFTFKLNQYRDSGKHGQFCTIYYAFFLMLLNLSNYMYIQTL